METGRGRWFLAEFARRNRHADTEMLLAAFGRLENVMRTDSAASIDRVRHDLVDMAEAIARTKADIAALNPDGEQGRIDEATEELDSVVTATETATSEILASAEQIQEIAWTMREQGVDLPHCDALDARATDIYTACSFQDLTGQRTRKVIQVLRYLENRITAMIDLWGAKKVPDAAEVARSGDRALLNGPAKPGHGLDQADVDMVMGPAESPPRADAAAAPLQPATAEPAMEIEPEPAPTPVADAGPADPLAPLAAMSYEEKVALFS